MKNNFVQKNLYKFNKPKVFKDRKKEAKKGKGQKHKNHHSDGSCA